MIAHRFGKTRSILTALAITAAGWATATAQAQDGAAPAPALITLGAILSVETPAIAAAGATGGGSAYVTFNPATRELAWEVHFWGLTTATTNAHFHGANGMVQVAIPGANVAGGTTGPLFGSAIITQAQADALLAGQYYVNIHTSRNPGGEIRGTVRQAAVFDMALTTGVNCPHLTFFVNETTQCPASLNLPVDPQGAAFEPTPGAGMAGMDGTIAAYVPWASKGEAFAVLDNATNELRYHVTYNGMRASGTMAHIGEVAATAANNVATMTSLQVIAGQDNRGLRAPLIGSVTLTPELAARVRSGGDLWLYVATVANMGGEIRGALVPRTDKPMPPAPPPMN